MAVVSSEPRLDPDATDVPLDHERGRAASARVGVSLGDNRSRSLMLICLFGGVTAFDDDGKAVDLGAQKCQAVLASLALSAGVAVPVGRIVDRVWGEDPPRTAEKTLQSYVTRLRKGLGTESIVRVGAAYRLEIEPDQVDVVRFQRLLRVGDHDGALAAWTGTPLAGLTAPGLDAVVEGLVEQWLGVVETNLGTLIETDPGAAVGPLTEMTASYPFREGLVALLMTALYRVGRQADALAAFRTARERLVEQLGVEPGPRLRELEAWILGQDDQLAAPATADTSASDVPTGMVTFGFCDVEDSVSLWALHRSEMSVAMARHDEIIRAVTSEHEGYIFSTGGDLFGVAFRRVSNAVAWAKGLQTMIECEPWPSGVQLRVRVGLHIGESDERGGDYFGPVVNVAARLAAAGHGGQVLASGAIAALIDDTTTSDLGAFWLKGLLTEQRIFQLDADTHPRLHTNRAHTGNLPRRIDRLIGRSNELDAISEALDNSAVVTLLGPGGIGKTRLAIGAATALHLQPPNEAWLVELANVASSADVPQAVAEAFHVRENSAAGLIESIVSFLQPRADVIVLDNCEHVIDGAARFAQVIVERCPDTRILTTSREGLGVAGERLLVVGPLEPAGAGAELFNERASAASSGFDPIESSVHVDEICRRLDGVPLAIELAAARVSRFTPADMVDRLDDHLRLLTGGRRTSVERHRTLRATLQWSYDLLTDVEQLVFERLGVFAGSFDLRGAHAIVATEDSDIAELEDLLDGLVDRSMLIIESGRFTRRFRLLETMRQFAIEQLAARGDTDLVAERHARWCLSVGVDIGKLVKGRGEFEGVARLNEHWTNLRAALNWAIETQQHRLAFDLVRPFAAEVAFRSRGEIADWFERVLAITPPDDIDSIAFSLVFVAHHRSMGREYDEFKRIVQPHRENDHPLMRFACAVAIDDDDAVLAAAPAAAASFRASGNEHLAGFVDIIALSELLGVGNFGEVDRRAVKLVERFVKHGTPTMLNWTLSMSGLSAELSGDHERADRLADNAAEVATPEGTLPVSGPMEARCALRRGDRRGAVLILRDHLEMIADTDVPGVVRLACMPFIEVMVDVDQLHDAAPVLRFLETSGTFGSLTLRALDAETATKIAAADPDPGATSTATFTGAVADSQMVIAHMADVLDRLIDTDVG